MNSIPYRIVHLTLKVKCLLFATMPHFGGLFAGTLEQLKGKPNIFALTLVERNSCNYNQ